MQQLTERSSHAWHLVGLVLLCASLAGCTAASPTPSRPSSSGPAGSADSTSSDMEGSFATTVSVPAGGSVDVPLAFEGATSAGVTVSAPDSNIGATFAGTTLEGLASGSGGWSLGANLSNPVDGPLHITNSGSQSETVGVLMMIETGRKLTVTPATTIVANGQSVGLDVVLTQPVTGDSVGAELVDPAGKQTPITLTAAGSGHWTGQGTPTVGGTNTINAWTTGNGIRRTQALLNVSSGTVSLGSNFTERLNDTNGDGLSDQLILTLPITVAKAGPYRVRARLVDSTGSQVAIEWNPTPNSRYYDLRSGEQPIDLTFLGADIYKSGRSGPYRLVDVMVLSNPGSVDEILEANVPDMGATQPYDYRVFAH